MSDARLRAQCEARLGTTLRGKWVLEKLVGIGGMAAVYAGAHKIGRRDAIKILHAEVAKSTEIRTRFEQEAAVANSFSHPGAVEIRDIDVTEDGCPFLVMEFLQGETLGEWARRLFEKGQEFPLEDLMRFTSELLSALGAAHAQGIVHRDIKLDNVFITESGSVKVLDFGIARITHGRAITVAGARLGTAAYMAPEQVRGEQVDGRADLFSVGATLYRLLSKQRIHEANSEADLFIRMGTEQAPAILSVAPEVPADIAAIVDRSLKFKADQRYPNAAAMAADVQRVRANLGSQQKRDVQLSRTVPLSMAVLQSAAQSHSAAQSQAAQSHAGPQAAPASLRTPEPTQLKPNTDDGPASIGNAKTNALPVQKAMLSTVAAPMVAPSGRSSASLASVSQPPQSLRSGSGDSSANFKALKSSDMNLGTQAMPNLGSLLPPQGSAGVSQAPNSLRTQQLPSSQPQSLAAPSDGQSLRPPYASVPHVRASLRETSPPVTPAPATKPSGPEWVPAAPGVAVLQDAPRKKISPWLIVAILGLLGLAAGAVGVLLIQGANAESSEESESGDSPKDKKSKKAKAKTSATSSAVAPAAPTAAPTSTPAAVPSPATPPQPSPTPQPNPADPSPKPAPSGTLPKPSLSSFTLPKFR